MVNAANGCDFSSSFICQNPEVRSSVEKVGQIGLANVPNAFVYFLHGIFLNVGVEIKLPEVLQNSESLFLGYTENW